MKMISQKRWSVINKRTGRVLTSKDTRSAARAWRANSRNTNTMIYDNVAMKAVR